jgi:hypothetical protein
VSLLEEIERIKSKENIQAVYVVQSGFSGGEYASQYMNALAKRVNKGFDVDHIPNLKDVLDLDSLIPPLRDK